jgi:tripartite-type tricarboxylate transporter receptor subunit TctC
MIVDSLAAIARRLLVAVAAIFPTQQALAADVSLEGKTVTVIIPSSVGGNTDALGRVFGKYLQQYLPGKPTVTFQNIPGAGGIKAMNYLVQQVKADGLTSISGSASNLDPTVIRTPSVQYDPTKFQMYGGFPSPTALIILRKDAVAKFNDRSQPKAIMGNVNAERNTDQMTVWGPEYLGWNLRWVLGYQNTKELMLAVQRGEIDLMITYGDALIDEMAKTGAFVFPAQSGDAREGKLVRSPRFPDVPLFSDLIRPKLKTPAETKAFAAWETLAQVGKWMGLPPGTPPEVVKAYRAAFSKIVRDKNFEAEASKILGEGYTTATGEEMQKVAVDSASVSDEDLRFFEQLREKVGIHIEPTK